MSLWENITNGDTMEFTFFFFSCCCAVSVSYPKGLGSAAIRMVFDVEFHDLVLFLFFCTGNSGYNVVTAVHFLSNFLVFKLKIYRCSIF